MPLHNISYQHWDGVHLGVWHRRWAIAWNGLSACLRNKWMRHLLLVCWGGALTMTTLLFLVGQLLVADSIVVQWVGNFNPGLQSFAHMLTSWLEEHPEISVRTTQNVLFYYFCKFLLQFSIFALGMSVPMLITRDLTSNAIIIYSSKAVTRVDYLLGKFSTAFGIMVMSLLGPACVAWLMGNLLAPDWRFFWHSRAALFNVLAYGLVSMTLVSFIALGISAISSKEKSTIALWYSWWIVGYVFQPIAEQTLPWLRHLSFTYNLDQIALALFRLGDDLKRVQENVPVFGEMLRNFRRESISKLSTPTTTGAILWSVAMVAVAVFIIRKRAKPE